MTDVIVSADDAEVEIDGEALPEVSEIAVPAQGPPGPLPFGVVTAWTAGAAYAADAPASVVTFDGETYVCTADHTAAAFAADLAAHRWLLIARRGNQGPTGTSGPQGVPGPFAFDTIVPWTTATAYHATPPASAV
ncbi:hypothetical protein, partial [Rhodoplanes roseus]